ncbi:MAG TPA: hypothetical protein VJJ52_01310 [Candidatus Nanoarchaeia archaeon]|nr:hypothetical protein [Candidatus Nanoarchaeia archaeon]
MNKAYGIAALVSFLVVSASNPHILPMQSKDEPIKFGQKAEQTYEVSQRPYSDVEHNRTLNEKQGQRWGHAHTYTRQQYGFNEGLGFVLHGILDDGTEFIYRADDIGNSLHLTRNGLQIGFIDSHNTNPSIRIVNDKDYATVNGEEVNLGGHDFYESPRPVSQSQGFNLNGKLHDLYSNYNKWLNVRSVRALVEKPRETEPAQLENLLDAFVK